MDKLLVGLNDYKVLDYDNPIGYTRDINCCLVALIHREKSSILMHIESYKYNIEIDNFIKCLKNEKDNKILSVDIFKGENTELGNLSVIKFILHRLNIDYKVYDVFKNLSNETSIGYNFNSHKYFIVSMNKGKPIFKVKNLKKSY